MSKIICIFVYYYNTMKGIKFIYKDGTTCFVEHSDLLDGEWSFDQDILEIYKDFDFY